MEEPRREPEPEEPQYPLEVMSKAEKQASAEESSNTIAVLEGFPRDSGRYTF